MKQENAPKRNHMKWFAILGIMVIVFAGIIFASSGFSGRKLLSQFSGNRVTPATVSSMWQPSVGNPNRVNIWNEHTSRLDPLIVRMLARGKDLSTSGYIVYLDNITKGINDVALKPEYQGNWEIQNIISYITFELADTKKTLQGTNNVINDIVNVFEGSGAMVGTSNTTPRTTNTGSTVVTPPPTVNTQPPVTPTLPTVNTQTPVTTEQTPTQPTVTWVTFSPACWKITNSIAVSSLGSSSWTIGGQSWYTNFNPEIVCDESRINDYLSQRIKDSLVKMTDETGADGTLNWSCYGMTNGAKDTSKETPCAVAKTNKKIIRDEDLGLPGTSQYAMYDSIAKWDAAGSHGTQSKTAICKLLGYDNYSSGIKWYIECYVNGKVKSPNELNNIKVRYASWEYEMTQNGNEELWYNVKWGGVLKPVYDFYLKTLSQTTPATSTSTPTVTPTTPTSTPTTTVGTAIGITQTSAKVGDTINFTYTVTSDRTCKLYAVKTNELISNLSQESNITLPYVVKSGDVNPTNSTANYEMRCTNGSVKTRSITIE